MRKKQGLRSLYWQLLFVTLAFALMVISSGIFVNNMLMNYLEREAENILTQTQIRIEDELREAETLTISIVKDVRNIIIEGGSAHDVQVYFSEISAELLKKEGGFVFDGLHGSFDVFGNALIPTPEWTVPADYNVAERPWYKTAVEADGKITATPVYLSSRSGEYQINFTCRIFNDAGEPLGVIAMDVPLNNITKFVADMRLVQGGYGFLADEDFELIAHYEPDFVTRHMSGISPGFRQIVEMMKQAESFIKFEGLNYQGIRSIFYCKRIDNGWALGIMTPKNVYYHDLRTLMLFLGVLGIVLMLVVDIILIHIDAARRSVELQLIAAKEAAEQSNRSKGLFLANMSHEIRTPMNAILGISEIQLQSTTLPPEVEEALNQIYDSGNLLLNIINDILDFSKIEAGKMEIVPVKYDVPSLLNDTAQLNRLRYESKPIEFMLDVDENTPLELYGDELRIKQILNNLLSNAFKYTDEGKVGLSVCAEPGEDKEIVSLVFRVSDTGQGMREDQITRLFDAYSRFNMEANRTVTGAGLGMNIVKRLIEMMDGEIMVESEIGKGSTITVRLPQKSVGPAVCGAEFVDNLRNFRFRSIPISKKAQIIHEYMPYGSVLVVDDVVSNIYVIRGLLRPYGLRIETATSGIEAIDKIKDNNVYDIVFMDHMMPVMDGMKATKIIRDMGYTRTIIAFTANAIVGQSDIFLANGFDGFISKPIDSRELDAVLKTFIRDKQPPEVIEAVRRGQHQKEQETNDTSEVEKYFVLDAEKAIKVIEEIYPKLHTSDTEVVDSYITAVHGMKSALANIDETKLSGVALSLERAGRERNFTVITEESPAFINALRVLIDQYKPVYNDETTEISGDDMVYLRNKLLDIKLACEKFDITAARNALEDLRRKTWPRHVNETLDEISVHLLHSAFKKAAAAAENMTKT